MRGLLRRTATGVSLPRRARGEPRAVSASLRPVRRRRGAAPRSGRPGLELGLDLEAHRPAGHALSVDVPAVDDPAALVGVPDRGGDDGVPAVAGAGAAGAAGPAPAVQPGADAVARVGGLAVAELDRVVVTADERLLGDQAVAVRVVAGGPAVIARGLRGRRGSAGKGEREDDRDARVLMTLECRNSPVALYPRDEFGRPWGWFGDTCPHGRTGGPGGTGVRRRARRGGGRARPGLRRGAPVAGRARVARAARLRRGGPRRARCAARGPADQGPASGGRAARAQTPLRAGGRRLLRARRRGQQPRGGLRRGAHHAGARLGPGRLSRRGDRAPDADPARAQAPAGRAPSAHDRLHTRAAWRHAHRRLRRGPAAGPQGLRRAGYVTSPETSGNAGEIRLLALGLALLDLALELLHDVGVAQRRDVAELAALGDVAQQAAHDLARACLGQVVGPDDALRPRELADPLGHMLADVADQLLGAVEVALQGHERRDRLAGVLVGLADARRLGHMLVADDRGLDLGRGHPVAGDVDHVVDAPDDPEVAVLVPARRVSDEVDVLAVLRPVRLDVALVVAVERAQHPGPRPAQGQVALLAAGVVALLVDDSGLYARQRRAGRPRLHVLQPGQRGDEDRARLGLPPGVDNWAALAADHVVVPEPGLRVDRLSDRAEEAQAGEVVLLRMLDAPLHARADRRRGRVEDRDLVALDQVPPDVLVRVVRRALVHHRRAAVGQRPIDDVGVPGDPADVGRAPEDVGSRLEVEHHTVGVCDLRQVAAGGVLDALRLGRRPRRVEDVERVL